MDQQQHPWSVLARLRRPEYTGDNRCLPCTAVNLVLTAVLVGVIAVGSPAAALAVAAVSLASIYLRGYLVPGTPTLTKRYLPDRVLGWFGKSGAGASASVSTDDFDVVAFLDRTSIVVDDGNDIALDPAFETRLEAAALDLDSDAALTAGSADLLDLDPDRISFVSAGSSWRVVVDESIRGQWESRAAFIADLAAHHTLSEWAYGWDSVPGAARGQTLSAIRACLDTCPICSDKIQLGTELVSSCCREYEVVAATCQGCNARLFETDATAVADS
ncbi:hypothetical protein EKH57_15765 [Halorubrum sp. BOL3-1]|uniref:hypothetical protein n=1 Tax=Halorubrum sp. BOL3-1 TaxID=2497325 RepID=UPI001004F229|nr:hypothetical protein [Halorubrum sp. BOL3-1]QAU14042.1 hypothetical protein EKH57_15765 [Halorubrum sp. BOL3-1]